MENKYLTVSQAADIIGINTQTLRRWDVNGKCASVRHPINNYRVYTVGQINTLVKEIDEGLNVQQEEYSLPSARPLPYFEANHGKLFKMDAIQFLKSLPSQSVHLIFADPPYNIKKAEWDTFESQKKYIEWSMEWIREAERVLHPTGSLYICGFSEILADIKWSASSLFAGCKWLIWHYRNKANLGSDWGRSHESIIHFRKTKKFIFNTDEVRVPYNAHTLKYPKRTQAETSQYANGKSYVWLPHPKGGKPKDVLEIPTLSNGSWERFDHPTQKPVELLKKIILSSSNQDSVVIDPFGGSGTTFAVAEAFGRKWLGSELDKDFCATIIKRLTDKGHLSKILSNEDQKAVIRRGKLREKVKST